MPLVEEKKVELSVAEAPQESDMITALGLLESWGLLWGFCRPGGFVEQLDQLRVLQRWRCRTVRATERQQQLWRFLKHLKRRGNIVVKRVLSRILLWRSAAAILEWRTSQRAQMLRPLDVPRAIFKRMLHSLADSYFDADVISFNDVRSYFQDQSLG